MATLGGVIMPLVMDAVAALMPHFERAIEFLSGIADGFVFFKQMLDAGLEPLDAMKAALHLTFGEDVADTIMNVVDGVLNFIDTVVDAAQPVIDWVKENMELKDVLIGVGVAVAAVLIPAIWGVLSPILAVIAAAAALALIVALVRKAWESDFLGIRTFVENTLATIRAWWAEHGDEVMAKAKEIYETVKEGIKVAIATIREIIEKALAAIKQFWADHGEEIMAKAKAIWDTILEYFQYFKEQFMRYFEAFKLAFSGDWEGFGEKLREIWDEGWEKIKQIGETVWTTIKDFFKNTDWGAIGKSILEGIATGIKNNVTFLADAAKAAASAALDAAKGFLGIRSRSTVFMGLGKNMMEGMAYGISASAGEPAWAAVRAADKAVQRVTHITVTGNYEYQSEQTLTQELKLMAALYG